MSCLSHTLIAPPAARELETRRAERTTQQNASTGGSRAWTSTPTSDSDASPKAGHTFRKVQLRPADTRDGSRLHSEKDLVVGTPDDPYELEAERAADQAIGLGKRSRSVQASSGTPAVTPKLSPQIDRAVSEGRPLPAEQRTFYENRLGHDFGSVRIHNGPASSAAASSVGAQAFTRGKDIYFNDGFYRPEKSAGQWLLAHELTHTVQQQRPNVIARQPMNGAAVLDAPAPGADIGDESPSAADSLDDAVSQSPRATMDQIDSLLLSDPSDSSGRVRRRVAGLRPSMRQRVTSALVATASRSPARGVSVANVLASAGQGTDSAGSARTFDTEAQIPRPERRPKERVGTPESRAVQSAVATAPAAMSARGVARPATPLPDVSANEARTRDGAAAIARSQPSIVPSLPPNLVRPAPAGRAAGGGSPVPADPTTQTTRGGDQTETPEDGAAPGVISRDAATPVATAGSSADTAVSDGSTTGDDDNRPLRLADLFEERPDPGAGRTPGGSGDATGPQASSRLDRPEGSPGVAAGESAATGMTEAPVSKQAVLLVDRSLEGAPTPAESLGPDDTEAQMEGLATRLETSLAEARQNLQTHAATIRGRVRQQAAGARAGIRSEVERAVSGIQAGQSTLLSQVSSMVAAAHGQIDTNLVARKAEATQTGRTSQQTIGGIFSGHRATVEKTVNDNVRAAEQLRRDKAEEARRRNRADIRTVYGRVRAKMRTYPGTNRGVFISGAVFDVAEGTANKMREQEPDIISAVNEVTAPLPQHFREQGASALEGFDVNLPQILGSVDSGVTQTHADQDQRARDAHQRLDETALQTRAEISGLAAQAIAEAGLFGPQLEAQLDHELARILRAISAAPTDVMNRIAPPIEEAIVLFRTGRDPDVEAAGQLTDGLHGFLGECVSSTVASMEQAGEASEQRFQSMRSGARQSMRAQLERSNTVFTGANTGFASTVTAMVSNFDIGFGVPVGILRETLTGTEQSIRDQLSPVVSQLDDSFRATLNDTRTQIDSRINDGLGKNTEAINDLDGKMEEAADDAAFEWDHPVLSALAFIAGIIVGIVKVLVLVLVLLAVTLVISAVFGVGMLAAGLILLAGMAAFSIGYAFGARLAAGQGVGEAFVGAVGDFARAAPGMLYDMTGIPKLRRAFSDERMTPYERGKLIGEGGTELVLAIFMVRGAAKATGNYFRNLPRFRPPAIEPIAIPEPVAPRAVVEPVAGTRPVVEPVAGPRPAAEPVPTPRPEPVSPRPTAESVASRSTIEPTPPRPAPAAEPVGPIQKPGPPRERLTEPSGPELSVTEPTAPRPQPLPENVRPLESARPSQTGRKPQLRTQRPTTTADEFAARVRARNAAQAGEGRPPTQPQSQVQPQPVAEAVGAEGYRPQQLESPGRPRLDVIEGSGGRPGAPSGRSTVEVRASGEPPGAGGPGVRPVASSTEGPLPARGGGRQGPSSTRAPQGQGRPTPAKEVSAPQRPPAGKGKAPAGGGRGEASEPTVGEPVEGAQPGMPRRSRATQPTEGEGVGSRAGQTGRGGRGRGRGRSSRSGEGEPRQTKAEKAVQARRDAESAAIQRELQGLERPPQKQPTADELLSGRRSESIPEGPEAGEAGGAQVRRGPGGRQVVSEDRAVAEAAGSAFERPMVRDFAASQSPTAETFGSGLGNWSRLRTRFPRLAELFSSGSRPDGVSVDPVNRRINLFDATSRPNATHWEGTLEYMQRLLDDPIMRELFNGWEITAREAYWESGFKRFRPSRTARIGPPTGGTIR